MNALKTRKRVVSKIPYRYTDRMMTKTLISIINNRTAI